MTLLSSQSFQVSIVSSADPAWFTAMSEKVWTAISTNTVDTPGVVAPGEDATTIRYVMQSWNGGVVVPDRYSLVLPACGGHNNYDGNEVYEFKLNQASPAWTRLTNPQPPSSTQPASTHTYSLCVTGPNGDVWMCGLGSVAPTGFYSSRIWKFDISALTWSQYDTVKINSSPYAGANYDSTTNRFYVLGSSSGTQQMAYVDAATGNSTNIAIGNTAVGNYGHGHIESSERAWFWNGANGFYVFDITTDSVVKHTISSLGSGLNNLGGMVYDSAANGGVGAIYLHATDGSTIQKITRPANPFSQSGWSIANVSGITGSAPGSAQGNGTYGRFAMVTMPSGDRCLILVHTTGTAVYGMRVPAGGL